MTVYVDNARNPLGRMIMCHMLADSDDELHAMADRLGLKREWYQGDHYDISQVRKARAIRFGAIEISSREIARLRKRRRLERARALLAEVEART
jgi:hypothetical protein